MIWAALKYRLLLFSFIFAAFAPVATYATDVSGPTATTVFSPSRAESGIGLLANIKGNCVVITAGHVVEGGVDAEVGLPDYSKLRALRIAVAKDADVAILKLQEGDPKCASLPGLDKIDRALRSRAAMIMVAVEGGDVVQVPVRITLHNEDQIRLYPTSDMLEITQGMSGAPVVVDNVPIAILTHIDEMAKNQPGIAYRLDAASTLFGAELPLARITIIPTGLPVGEDLKTALSAAETTMLAALIEQGAGGTDIIATLKRPDGPDFVVTKMFESIAKSPDKIDALRVTLDAGLPVDTVLPARNPSRPADEPPYGKALFWHAIDAGASNAALLLLERGASPHAFREPTGTSNFPTMIFPFEHVYKMITDASAREAIFVAMIRAGLVLPSAPRSFRFSRHGTECPYQDSRGCSSDQFGTWSSDWGSMLDRPAFREILALARSARVPLATGVPKCSVAVPYQISVPDAWAEAINNIPKKFLATAETLSSQPYAADIEIEGFMGIFEGKAWYLGRQLISAFQDWPEQFLLLNFSKDGSQVGMIARSGRCNDGSICYSELIHEIRPENGNLVLVKNKERYIAHRQCRSALGTKGR